MVPNKCNYTKCYSGILTVHHDISTRFKGLTDFQYLAPEVPDLLDGLHGSEILDIETPLHLPPPSFCRVDHPFDYKYKTDSVSKDVKLRNTGE